LIKLDNVIPEYDKYIFLGDYVDSFDETDAVILFNLQEIIKFKQKYPEHVVLLLGNHDLQYMFSMKLHGCSGYRPSMYQELHKLFNDDKGLFEPITTTTPQIIRVYVPNLSNNVFLFLA